MKNIILFAAFLATSILSAQNFPGARPELLQGKEVKIMQLKESYRKSGYNNFCTDYEMQHRYAASSIFDYTPADTLVGRTFHVEKVEPYKDGKYTKAKVTLKDKGKGKILYYSYNSGLTMPPEYPFEVVGGLDLPADFYCDYIEKKPAQVGGDEYTTDPVNGIIFTKNNKDGATVYRMQTRTLGSTEDKMVVGKVTATLENGKVITKENTMVDVEANGYGGYVYTAVFFLDEKDIELLSKNKVISARIIAMETKIGDPDKLKGMFDCLLTK